MCVWTSIFIDSDYTTLFGDCGNGPALPSDKSKRRAGKDVSALWELRQTHRQRARNLCRAERESAAAAAHVDHHKGVVERERHRIGACASPRVHLHSGAGRPEVQLDGLAQMFMEDLADQARNAPRAARAGLIVVAALGLDRAPVDR